MTKIKYLLVVLLMVSLAFAATGCGQNEDSEIAAEVNGTEITKIQLDEQLEAELTLMGATVEQLAGTPEGEEMLDEMRKYVLQEMILAQLFAEKAEEFDVAPTEEEAQEQINELLETASEEEYQALLENMNWNDQDFYNFIYNQLLEKAVYDHVTAEIVASEEEISEYYHENEEQLKRVRARHILVQEEEKALELIELLNQGEDFAELAKEHSLDPGSGSRGGDLGYFGKGRMVPEFEEASFSLAKGEYTKEPVESEHGFHIILIEDRKETLEELREDIEYSLTFEEKSQLFNQFVEQIKDNANIVNNLE
ncbi:parvulin-like peptidyl-prolyl isomerase [Desulfitispora alkaliphila]|uniref:peptidylprolyl isomerase n=1 Tax=Desulfitispora alkaliphila TaxID=622674 RepID=UPI003D1F1A1D